MNKEKAQSAETVKEPFVRIVKKNEVSLTQRIIVRVAAVAVASLIILIFLSSISGFGFGKVIRLMFGSVFGNMSNVNELLRNAACLLIIAIALAPAFKMRFWNIGAQGQVLVGGLITAYIMLSGFAANTPNIWIILLAFVASIAAGAVWAVIPALFNIKWKTNETLFTLMMNYIAIQLVAACVDKWKGSKSALGTINPTTGKGYLPSVFGNPYGFVLVVAVILVILVFIYLRYTKHGYEISVVGESSNTARYAGINTGKVVLRTIAISGAICGLCGMCYVAGIDHAISSSTGGSYGFTAIVVTWAAKFNTFLMIPMSFAIVFLEKGAQGIYNNAEGVNEFISGIITAIFLFCIIGCEFFLNYKLIFKPQITAFFNKIGKFITGIFKKNNKEAQ